jgi:2,3-bisphosphoglycerate-independent phosphoglycerate mutase
MSRNGQSIVARYIKFFLALAVLIVLVIYPLRNQTSNLSVQALNISKIAPEKITKNGLEVKLSGESGQAEKLAELLSAYKQDKIRIEAPLNAVRPNSGLKRPYSFPQNGSVPSVGRMEESVSI